MIIIKDGILNIPECERFVGFTGDHNHTKKTFFIRSNPESGWLYRIYLTFDDGRHNFFTLPATFGEEGTLLEWNIQEDHILKSGLVKAQIKAFSEDNEVYHTTSDVFVAGKTAEEDDEFKNSNSEFLTFEKTLNDLYRKMMAASAKMPYVGENGNWFYYDEKTESYVDSGVSSAVAVADGTITPEKLDRKYLERCVTEYGETISTFAKLFEKVGRINRGGNLGFVKLYVSDNDNDTVLNYGYISGDFMAVGTPTNSDICLIDLRNGENWTVSKRDEEKYTAYKVDALTPRVVQLEKNAKISVMGSINSMSELMTYSFSKDYLYHFSATGSLGDLIGEGYCFGRYSTEENPETGAVTNKFLEVFNFTTLKTWKINFKEGTAELVAQGNDEEALSKKLEFVRINLEAGSNGDEELKALDIHCIGVAGGGKDFPFLFESYTAPQGVEVVEGLQAHVIQFKTYLKGPDIHKRFKRMYAHDGVEPIWSEWEPAEPETPVVTISDIGTMEIEDFQKFSFKENVLYKFDYYDSDCLGVYEKSYLKFISLRSGKTGKIDTTTGKVENTNDVPDYWAEYINSKIALINALQTQGGKDAFSFVVMADMHYPSNIGKNSPLLAKKILDKCSIKYALCLGDLQTRGCHETKELLLLENEAIEEMLSPIRDRLLQTEGNHDGSYGFLDRDGDGAYNNTDSEGNLKPEAQRETYVNNLTPAELHSAIYRKVGVTGNVHFDESGSGYYADDTANKVRYIILNTQCNDYELQEDGTSLYPKMWLMRFTQSQFDLVIDALNNIPSDSWNVVVAGHCPLWQEIGDKDIMTGVLNAYKNKTTYSGVYGGAAYTNLAEPLPDNTTDTTKWVNGYRINSTGVPSAEGGVTVSNTIPCTNGDVIRIKGVTLRENTDRIALNLNEPDGTSTTAANYYNGTIGAGALTMSLCSFENGIYTFVISDEEGSSTATGFRFAMTTPEDASAVIVTVNEEIVEGAVGGYDAVSVACDFSTAKGSLVGYFAGHVHYDHNAVTGGVPVISTRCDANEENTEELREERIKGTITEQSFDVFTVNTKEKKIYATKIGAGEDRVISY